MAGARLLFRMNHGSACRNRLLLLVYNCCLDTFENTGAPLVGKNKSVLTSESINKGDNHKQMV
jgi:hypothetical protein